MRRGKVKRRDVRYVRVKPGTVILDSHGVRYVVKEDGSWRRVGG